MTEYQPTSKNSNAQSTGALLLCIGGHISRQRRIQLGFLLLVMLASGAAELGSLGAALPFLAVISEPERLWQQPLVQSLASWVGFSQARDLLLPATLAFAAAAVVTALIRLTNLWLNGRMAAAVGSDLSCEAYKRTLYQPYGVHTKQNSSSVVTGLTGHVNRTVSAISAVLQLTTGAVVTAGLLIGLMVIDWQLALSAAALFGSVYGLLAITARNELRRNSEKIAEAAKQQVKAVQEGLGAIRDVLLDGNQSTYVEIYRQADRPQRQLIAKNQFIIGFPRYAVEALGLVAIALLGGLLVLQRAAGASVIPQLGALALGAQRLLPAIQQVYSACSSIRSCHADLDKVVAMLGQPLPPIVRVDNPLPIKKSLQLKSIHFSYGANQRDVLQGLDLEIHRGERIGLIGTTGSGKSTLVNILMGLLEPTSGRVLVDGMNLHDPTHPEFLAAWRASIAHVPQNIYLADSSIAENIAFGLPKEAVNMAQVRYAAQKAQIADFIESSPNDYQAFVGERGIRISGGQRQRIGIARALYKQAKIIILDEATSALDSSTEESVMAAIESLSCDLTVVIIAHRLSTLSQCDRIIRLKDGVATDDGLPLL